MTSNVDVFRTKRREGGVPPVGPPIGVRRTEIDFDRARIEFEAGPPHASPTGSLHGGILCDVAEAAMGMAFASGISPDEAFTTIELEMNSLPPVGTARLVAEGRVAKRGRRLGVLEGRVTEERGERIAHGTSTCKTVPAAPREGVMAPIRNASA